MQVSYVTMGVESSRVAPLPTGIDLPATREIIMSSWTLEKINKNPNNLPRKYDEPTLSELHIALAGHQIASYFEDYKSDLKILEIMAGNCVASSIIQKILEKYVSSWISTDINSHRNRNTSVDFLKCNQVEAVRDKGTDSNVLLMISPTPYSYHEHTEDTDMGYGDYYATHDYIEQTKKGEKKFIIIIGELGASDGSAGMYGYMMDHPSLELVYRKMIDRHELLLFGGMVEKELFIFAIHKK